jgi:tetratricopeptide (TPR) repeat protein
MTRLLVGLALIAGTATVGAAQSAGKQIAQGDSAYQGRRVADALTAWQAALQADSNSYEALWRAAHAQVDLAEYDPDSVAGAKRFQAAEAYARWAVRLEPKRVEGHFALARVLGRASVHLTSASDRVHAATEVYQEANACLQLDPKHAGCLHALGAWHAKVAALEGFARQFANTLAGSTLFDQGTWAEAERDLTAAASAEPRRLIHHLALGQMYEAMGKTPEAKAQFKAVLDGAVVDYNDPHYKEDAKREIEALAGGNGSAASK